MGVVKLCTIRITQFLTRGLHQLPLQLVLVVQQLRLKTHTLIFHTTQSAVYINDFTIWKLTADVSQVSK